MDSICDQCKQIQSKSDESVRYVHLRSFYYRYSDDLLSHTFHFCPNCNLVWREDDSDYPVDSGFFWTANNLAAFVKAEGETLPADVKKTPAGIKDWIEGFSGQYVVDLFSRYYDEN